MNALNRFGRHIANVGRVMQRELHFIFTDVAVILFFFALPFIYPIIYTLIYNPEVVEKVPVCIVDNDRTPQSRHLVRLASASPSVDVYDYAPNMADAKDLMASGKVYAIIEIPHGYASKLSEGEQAVVPMYCDMTLLLRYRTLLSATTDLQMQVAKEVTLAKVQTTGASAIGITSLPVESKSNFLGDTQQGFASFVIPGIIMLILQQSMVLGIVILGAASRERARRNGGVDPRQVRGVTCWTEMWGKTLAYVLVYVPATIYIVRFIPELFSLPHHGNPFDYLMFLLPFLFASAFFGQIITIFVKEREETFLVVVFTSLLFLFLSGLTWPRYGMNLLWKLLSDTIPATWGVEGFIRINTNGASLAEVHQPYLMLWFLAAVYCVGAWWVTMRLRRKP